MLSLVVYGRNDQHGYNLHRRAALSLNALAEVLGEGDEIIFVDVGSPDGVATFPQAIDDLLTARARDLLRIIRVRPDDLERLGVEGVHIPEGLGRNIGARRSKADNPWLLFTNTDVVLVEPKRGDFRAALPTLAPGLHHAPRSEIPVYLWEMFERLSPAHVLETLRAEGRGLGLVQRVVAEDLVLFDNPGDFQLVSRTAFEAIAGFDESMRLPFHVDANFAARMRLSGGEIHAFDAADCYHCEHSRTVTRMNNPDEAANDADAYVHAVAQPVPPGQDKHWGAASEPFEEIQLTAPEARLGSYLKAQERASKAVSTSRYRADEFNSLEYNPESVSHFVADRLCALPQDARVGWFGADARLLEAVKMRLDGLGRRVRPLLGLPIAGAAWGETASINGILTEAVTLVFAFGAPGMQRFRDFDRPPESFAASEGELLQLDIAGALRAIAAYAEPRPVVVVNAVNTEFERMTRQLVQGALAPFSTRLRDGWLKPTTRPVELRLADMTPAAGAERRDGGIFAPANLRGEIVSHGSYFDLPAGRFRLAADIHLDDPLGRVALQRLRLDLMAWADVSESSTTLLTQQDTAATLDFEITPEFLARRGVAPLDVRISGNGRTPLLIKAIRVLPLGSPTMPLANLARAHRPR
ncbi:MAG: glycosyltransferase family 2 protein [Hyphomonadaceae bacterium]